MVQQLQCQPAKQLQNGQTQETPSLHGIRAEACCMLPVLHIVMALTDFSDLLNEALVISLSP